jgi:hypothetical protein
MAVLTRFKWYDPDAITTRDGYLEIEFAAIKNHNLDYRSGMLQSWNKMCFKGGFIEGKLWSRWEFWLSLLTVCSKHISAR